LVVVLPGRVQPRLRVGLPIRFNIKGFDHVFQQAALDSVSHEIVGPSSLGRWLGDSYRDALHLEGPLVVATAELRANGFEADGHTYRYAPGLAGSAWVKLGEQSLLIGLLPILRVFAHR
jgi:hypothetical protein